MRRWCLVAADEKWLLSSRQYHFHSVCLLFISAGGETVREETWSKKESRRKETPGFLINGGRRGSYTILADSSTILTVV